MTQLCDIYINIYMRYYLKERRYDEVYSPNCFDEGTSSVLLIDTDGCYSTASIHTPKLMIVPSNL